MPQIGFHMAILPFVVQPRRKPITELVGTEDSGQIEVERRGYLTTGEKGFVQQVQQYEDGTGEIITISRRISNRYKIPLDKAYSTVMSIVSGNSKYRQCTDEQLAEIEQDFTDELTSVVKGMAVAQSREELVMAACMLKYRVDPDFELSQMAEIHPDIISGLANLYRDEEAKVLEAFTKQDEEEKPLSVEEIEKKPRKGARSPSKDTTGSSSEDTLETPNSD